MLLKSFYFPEISRGSGDSWCITYAGHAFFSPATSISTHHAYTVALLGLQMTGTLGPQSTEGGGLNSVRHPDFFLKMKCSET